MLAYLKLIRIINVGIVVLTMYLVRYFLIEPILGHYDEQLTFSSDLFLLLVISWSLQLAGGNIINDYFDLDIDEKNKPHKVIIEKAVPVHIARFLYFIINVVSVVLGIYVASKTGVIQLGLIPLLTAYLLYAYSQRYKRKAFIGNFVVAALSATTLFLVWLFEYLSIKNLSYDAEWMTGVMLVISQAIAAYVFFAFITSLIREIIKDMEDMKGDEEGGCRTLPIVWGVKPVRMLVIFLILTSIAFTAFVQTKLFNNDLDLLFWYFTLLIQPMFIFLGYKLIKANTKEDFHYLSTFCKIIMLVGILSIILIKFI